METEQEFKALKRALRKYAYQCVYCRKVFIAGHFRDFRLATGQELKSLCCDAPACFIGEMWRDGNE